MSKTGGVWPIQPLIAITSGLQPSSPFWTKKKSIVTFYEKSLSEFSFAINYLVIKQTFDTLITPERVFSFVIKLKVNNWVINWINKFTPAMSFETVFTAGCRHEMGRERWSHWWSHDNGALHAWNRENHRWIVQFRVSLSSFVCRKIASDSAWDQTSSHFWVKSMVTDLSRRIFCRQSCRWINWFTSSIRHYWISLNL